MLSGGGAMQESHQSLIRTAGAIPRADASAILDSGARAVLIYPSHRLTIRLEWTRTAIEPFSPPALHSRAEVATTFFVHDDVPRQDSS